MKSIFFVITISVVHFILSIGLSIKSFGHAFSFYDTGRGLTLMESVNYWVVEILFFPIVTIFESSSYEGLSTIGKYFPFMLNSLFWGLCILFAYKFFFRRNKKF